MNLPPPQLSSTPSENSGALPVSPGRKSKVKPKAKEVNGVARNIAIDCFIDWLILYMRDLVHKKIPKVRMKKNEKKWGGAWLSLLEIDWIIAF